MKDRQNTINGWVLFAGVVALGASIVTGEIFKGERPEKMGYPIEGVEVEGASAEAEQPIAFYLASGDAAKGEQVFKKCAACHNADPGGANALGPALFGTMGKPIAGHPGFAYSDALKSVGGTWGWDNMSDWIANPKKFAPGTKMTFAGLSNPQDRADLLLFLNSRGGTLTVPPPPAATPEASADQAAAEADDAGAQKAENEPVLNEAQAAKGGSTLAGEGAPGEAPGQ
ncbi:MAG: cytochrome c family protein [Sphingomonas sp.]|nr:cytochrome c family protein [Sphingomonas sp.]